MRVASIVAAAGLLTLASAASADFLAVELDFEFSGASAPGGSGPWLRAEFSSATPGEVNLKLISLLSGVEKVTGWYFNLDPALSATGLSVSHDAGQGATGVSKGADDFKADGDGYFDLLFSFPKSGDVFGAGDTAEFTITSADAISAASFAYLSVNGPVGKNGFMSAAHVQGIGAQGEDSGWIAGPPGQVVVVPLPAPVALGGAGLAMAAGVGVLRRRK